MTRITRDACLVFGTLILLLFCGCKQSTTTPALPTVRINPIVVLKPGEQIGGASNRGCRLTLAQMTLYLNNLNAFCKSHLKFQISYPVQGSQANPQVAPLEFEDVQLTSADLPFQPGARKFTFSTWILSSLPTANNLGLWSNQKVNVFFTGNVVLNVNSPNSLNANTVDPSDAQGAVVRHLFINDLGFVNGNAQVIPSWHVLEHEFCHYLLRQKSTQNGRYTQFEHTFNSSTNQLMRPNTPHPAIIVAQDATEIMQRVRSGSWNAP